MFHEGLTYSAINTARSALSAFLGVMDINHIGAHPLVVRFMDLSNAYFSVPVATSDRSYLKSLLKKEFYQFVVLPNGLSSAPRIFTKVLKPVYVHLRKLGFVESGYIDDSFLMADSYDTCSDNVRVTKQLLKSVGFSINFAKSMLTPRQEMEHLGFVLDSQTMTVAVTKEEQDKLIDKCHFVLEHRSSTIRLVA